MFDGELPVQDIKQISWEHKSNVRPYHLRNIVRLVRVTARGESAKRADTKISSF